MIKNIIFSLLAILLATAAITVLSLIGAAIVLGSAWLLLFVAPLTFFQASLLSGSIMFFVIFATQRDLDLDFISMMMHAVVLVPLISFIFNGITWMVNGFISLSYEETLFITSLAGIPILYGFYLAIWNEINAENEREHDEDEDEYEYEYDEEEEDEYRDEEELRPKIHFRKKNKRSNQPTPADILEELKKASQKANEKCYCGSGKKYRRCHGRKSWN